MNYLFKIIDFLLRKFNRCLVFVVDIDENGIENNNVIKKIVISKTFDNLKS
jgi:hypothetical protein